MTLREATKIRVIKTEGGYGWFKLDKPVYKKQCGICGYTTPEGTLKEADDTMNRHLQIAHGWGKISTNKNIRKGDKDVTGRGDFWKIRAW